MSPQFQHKKSKSRPLRISAVSALISGAVMLISSVASAEIPLSGILESRFGRYLLMQNREVEELLGQVSHHRLPRTGKLTRAELLEIAQERLSLPEFAGERNEIEGRLREVLARFDQRLGSSKSSASRKAKGLPTEDERRMLDLLAAEELRLDPEWRPRQLDSTFFDSIPSANFKSARETFAKAARPAASRSVKGFFKDMRTCLANSTPSQMHNANVRYLLTQLAFDEAMTLGGVVVAAGGIDDIDLKSLPSDLFFTAVASMGDSWVVGRPGRFSVRWFRLVGAGAAESGLDTVVYQIRQHLADEPLEQEQLSTRQRFAYNTSWGALYAPVSIGLYKLVTGLECMHKNAALIVAIRAGVGVAGSAGYYSLRKQVASELN